MPQDVINIQANNAEAQLLASSWLIYNNLLLVDVLTESYEVNEYRSDDGAQVLGHHHVIKVTGLIARGFNSFSYISAADQSVAVRSNLPSGQMPNAGHMDNIRVIRDILMQDRKPLRWAVGGKVVLESPARVDGINPVYFPNDNMNGPKPLYCHVTQVTGTSAFYVRFAIETWINKCASFPRFIQSHRYSMAHDVDGDTWLTTRMVTGQVKFNPEWLQRTGIPPTRIEPRWFHPVPDGFKRQNVKVQAHPNGMEVAYSFMDQEVTLPLGSRSPATKLAAEFSLASSLAEGKPALTQAAIHVAAVGPKHQYRFNLLVMAMSIAQRKLQKPGHVLTSDITITYSLDNTMVDLSMKAIWKPLGIGMEGLQINATGLDTDEDYGDLDFALQPFRAVGEPLQGNQSMQALSPKLRFSESAGTYSGIAVGSSIINGCFRMSDSLPENIEIDFETDDAPYKAMLKMTAELNPVSGDSISLTMVDDAGNNVPMTLQLTSILTIPMLDTGLSYIFTNGIGLYEDWQMTTRYHTSHNKAVMPVSSAQGGSASTYVPPQVASLGLPYTLKVVDWTIGWIGPDANSIILPSPDTQDPNDVLLEEHITPAVPSICNSTNKAWRVSGTYWYMSKKLRTSSYEARTQFGYDPNDINNGFAFGKSITDPDSRTANVVGLSRFIAGYSPSFVG